MDQVLQEYYTVHENFVTLAKQLIAENGATHTWRRYTNPGNGIDPRSGPVDTDFLGVKTDFNKVDDEMSLIKRESIKVLCVANIKVEVGDEVINGEGDVYSVYFVHLINPGTTKIIQYLYLEA